MRVSKKMELLELLHKDKYGNQHGLFKCSCSKTRISRLSDVRAKRVTKCKACNKLKQSEIGKASSVRMLGNNYGATHGCWGTPLYMRWAAMKHRVTNEPAYTAKNITVCKRWLDSFDNFKEDMQDTFFEHAQLDRIENSKGYSKDNCQWLNSSEHGTKSCKERWNA